MTSIRARVALAGAVLALAGAAGLSACGDDEPEPAATTTEPAATTTTAEPAESEDPYQGAEDDGGASGGGSGGVPAPPTGSGSAPSGAEDSPEHDVPPEPGSPAQRFEQFCEENPKACG